MNVKAGLVTLALAVMLSGATVLWIASAQRPRPIPLNELAQLVKVGQVESIEVGGQDGVVTTQQHQIFSVRVDEAGSLPRLLEDFGVTADQLSDVRYSVSSASTAALVAAAASTIVPFLLLVGLLVLVLRNRGKQGDMLNFGKARARVFDTDRPLTTFDDVAGVEEAKTELQEGHCGIDVGRSAGRMNGINRG